MRLGSLIGAIMLVMCLIPVRASGDPGGVWVPVIADGLITRIHVSGAALSYTATIDYRCGLARCSTLQSLIEGDDAQHPTTYSVDLEGVGPAPILVLRWQRGPPCNRVTSVENPLVFWSAAIAGPTGKTRFSAVGHSICFAHPLASPRSAQPVRSEPRVPPHPNSVHAPKIAQ